MKKNKSPESLSAAGLVEMARNSLRKAEKEALEREAANKERIASLTTKESGLEKKIESEKDQLEKMIIEFDVLEKKQSAANLAELEKGAMTKEDVKSGRISLTAYQAQQTGEDEIKIKVMEKTLSDLETSRDMVRSKGTDIIRLELELYEAQVTIHNLMTNPVKSLRRSLREQLDILDFQSEGLIESLTSAHSFKIQKEHELSLIEHGVSASGGGFVWQNITLAESYRLQNNPVFPIEHIVLLMAKLSEVGSDETIRLTVTLHDPSGHWPGDPVTIRRET